ncbi:MAG: ArsA-related P-loop ATPase [Acidimicrobiia bacterium]
MDLTSPPPQFAPWRSSRVVVVAGKGGVGKTTTTAALAVAAARDGASVLVIEVEGKSGLSTMFGGPALTYEERELAPRIRARTLTPDEALLEYLEQNALGRLSRRLLRTGAIDVVSTAVPGMKDILVLGKVKQLERERVADLILVDAPAAGHAITFLMSPRGLLDAVRGGPIRKQAEDVVELIGDPTRCQVALVTIPEETPVNELVDTAFALEDRVGVKLAPVVVNGCLGAPFTTLDADDLVERATWANMMLGADEAAACIDAAHFRAARSANERAQIERLHTALPLPQVQLPFLFTDAIGPSELDRLADALRAETILA